MGGSNQINNKVYLKMEAKNMRKSTRTTARVSYKNKIYNFKKKPHVFQPEVEETKAVKIVKPIEKVQQDVEETKAVKIVKSIEKVTTDDPQQIGFGNLNSSLLQMNTPPKIFNHEYSDSILQAYSDGLDTDDIDNSLDSITDLIIDMDNKENSVKIEPPTPIDSSTPKKHSKKTADVEKSSVQIEHSQTDEILVKAVSQFYIDTHLRVEVTSFKNERRIDIRTLCKDLYRTKIGVSLSIPQFKTLTDNIELVNRKFKNLKNHGPDSENTNFSVHLGGKKWMYLHAPYAVVHVRQKYLNNLEQIRVDKQVGVAMKWDVWQKFYTACQVILATNSDINIGDSCQLSHDSQIQYINCKVCTPYSRYTCYYD